VAGLFIGYYRNQDQQHKLVSSTNVLVTSDDPLWASVGSGKREIIVQPADDSRFARPLRAGDARVLVWQWYWVNGRWTASDALAKAYTAWSRLTGKGDDSAVIILYALQIQAGEARGHPRGTFARAAAPVIEKTLQQTTASPMTCVGTDRRPLVECVEPCGFAGH
jgi:EpsI family protein